MTLVMQAAVAAGHPDVSGAALEAQYFMRGAVPEWRHYLDLWKTDSAKARARTQGTFNISYGNSDAETLDVLLPARPVNDAPVQILIHGGYWRALHKDDFTFLAPPLAAAGIISVVINYALCPSVTMSELTEQCRRAVRWTRAHIAEFGGDPENLHLTGHSAGAHLAVMMALSPDLAQDIRSMTALSGIYDLAPVSLCSMQNDLYLTPAEIVDLSPMHKTLPAGLKLLVAAGSEETAAFRWQSEAFSKTAFASGPDCTLMTIPGHHHYSVVGVLCEPGPLRTAWLAMCGK